MTWHPTTNRIQFCHLTPEERVALEDWPHGIESFSGGWHSTSLPCSHWCSHIVYRGKPAPVVTSVWFNVYPDPIDFPYHSREVADCSASKCRIDVLRIDTCNGVSTAHLEGLKDE
jgi:hypothetical protein